MELPRYRRPYALEEVGRKGAEKVVKESVGIFHRGPVLNYIREKVKEGAYEKPPAIDSPSALLLLQLPKNFGLHEINEENECPKKLYSALYSEIRTILIYYDKGDERNKWIFRMIEASERIIQEWEKWFYWDISTEYRYSERFVRIPKRPLLPVGDGITDAEFSEVETRNKSRDLTIFEGAFKD